MRVILVSLGLLLVVAGCGNTVVTMQATPTPIVTPSSAIARFVKLTALAYERDVNACENPAAAGLVEQMRSAAAEMKMAIRIAPPNDGSQRRRVADRFGECVAASTTYLRRLVAEARGMRSVRAGRQDLLAAAAWAQRAQSAYGAYLADVKQPQARSVAPSPPPRPSSLARRGSSIAAPNWAGYGATGSGFRSVTATWREPDVSFPQHGRTTEVSTWVGLDGQGDMPLEQIGTIAFCGEGVPFVFHKAFFEMLPKPPVYFALDVNTGDEMTATVTGLGSHRFRLALVDDSTGRRFATIQTSKLARGLSAEIIVEPPSKRGQGLADFKPVLFTACAFNGRPLNAFNWTKFFMHLPTDAQPSALHDGGTGFAVTHR
jgi:hypothetical protein